MRDRLLNALVTMELGVVLIVLAFLLARYLMRHK